MDGRNNLPGPLNDRSGALVVLMNLISTYLPHESDNRSVIGHIPFLSLRLFHKVFEFEKEKQKMLIVPQSFSFHDKQAGETKVFVFELLLNTYNNPSI